MNARSVLPALMALVMLMAAPLTVSAESVDPDAARLQAELAALDKDPSLAELAGLERLRARQAVQALELAKSRERESALALAERRVETAALMAQVELLRRQALQLDREYDQLLIEASRREAEQARRDAERLRLQSMAREEEAMRLLENERFAREQSMAEAAAATAEAEQAHKLAAARAREAELAREEAELTAAVMAESSGGAALPPKQQVGDAEVYTLAGNAFASGSARLTPAAQASLRSLGALLAAGAANVRIEGHSDGQGDAKVNLALSRKRADAVADALSAAGVARSRLQVEGLGQTRPVADNATSEGRAQNRRVEISVR